MNNNFAHFPICFVFESIVWLSLYNCFESVPEYAVDHRPL